MDRSPAADAASGTCVAIPLGRVGHVYHPGWRVLRPEGAVPEPEVERRSGHDDQVGLPQRHRSGPGDQQFVAARQHPAGLPVGDHRQPQRLRRRPGVVLGATQPHVRSQHQDRPPGRPQQGGDLVEVRGVGRRGGRRPGRLQGRLGLAVDRLEGDVEENRAAVRAHRQPEGLVHRGAHLGRIMLGPGALGDGSEQRRMVHLLQAARAPAVVGCAPGQHHHRRAVEPRGGHRADRVGHAGPGGDRGQSRPPSQPRGRLRGEDGGLLVPHVHQSQQGSGPFDFDRRVVEREDVPAGQREQDRYAVPPGCRHRMRAAVAR